MMKNEEKRDKFALAAWARKGGVHKDQHVKSDAKALRKQARKDERYAQYEERTRTQPERD